MVAETYVEVMSLDMISERYGFTEQDFRNRLKIGNVQLTDKMLPLLGKTVRFCNRTDSMIYDAYEDVYIPIGFLNPIPNEDHFGLHFGETVMFKSWEEMQEDGSYDYNWFVPNMKYLCDTEVTIIGFAKHDERIDEVFVCNSNVNAAGWSLSTAMFVPSEQYRNITEDEWSAIMLI